MSVKPLQLFNTATRAKESLKTIEPQEVSLYCCGPTVYHYAHIGNLRTYVFEDLLVRTLKRAGYDVNHVMNITDVGHLVSDADEGEDKMEKGAAREGKTAWEVAEFYTQAFFEDFDKLHCLRPNAAPKATDHIGEMIGMVKTLEDKGYTYQTSDGVYFDTSRFSRYPDFARLDMENLQAGARVQMGEKRNPTDFALWKFSPKDQKRQMEWDSPWGKGFPGWHIECSAMSMKFLGDTFDIHCGGIDHIPVHHTNEIAQSECCTDKAYVNLWMHGEFLTEKAGKMSKSAGEFLTLSVLEKKGFRPVHYRFLILQAHYRSELQFDFESLEAAKSGFEGLLNRVADWDLSEAPIDGEEKKLTEYRNRFEAALFDDLNSPVAISVLFDLVKDKEVSAKAKRDALKDFDEVLGLGFEAELSRRSESSLPEEVLSLMKQRDEARASKDFATSDRIRDELQSKGYRVEDTPKGTRVIAGNS